MKPELNLLAAVFNEIESKYRAVKKQLEITADTSIEEGVKSEDKTITENLKSGEENKNTIFGDITKICSYQKEFGSPHYQPKHL